MVSHMDYDHVGGLFAVLENLKVGKVIIPNQVEKSENYAKFLKITNEKNIKVIDVKQGDVIQIEDNLQFKILWPGEKTISENAINNNAMVAKLIYKDFSCLFTGDIEEEAEKELVKLNKNELNSTILKIAHHGSKTSTTEKFLEKVNPKMALIGVGENNTFGHPNREVLERISKYTNKIYRTDKNGEINIMYKFYKKGKIKIRSLYGGKQDE